MSYIRAKQVDVEEPVLYEHGLHLPEINSEERPELDMNLDNEILDFVLALIGKVNDLGEGEALVVWKDIF